MGIGVRVQSHKAKPKKGNGDNTCRRLQNPGIPEFHSSITSHFNVIKKFGQKVSKEGNVDYDKHTDSGKNPYKKK